MVIRVLSRNNFQALDHCANKRSEALAAAHTIAGELRRLMEKLVLRWVII